MKARKQFRKASALSLPDDDEDDEGIGPPIVVARPGAASGANKKGAAKANKQSASAPKQADKLARKPESKGSLLSFQEDGEAAVHAAKKDRGATRLQPLRVPGLPATEETAPPAKASTYISAPGEYTKEKLADLARGQRSLPASKAPPRPAATVGAAPAFVLSGSFKKAATPVDDRFKYNTASLLQQQQAPEPEQRPPPRSGSGAEPAHVQPSSSKGVVSDDEDANIPDADFIAKAKATRERRRTAHMAPDYIPMGGTTQRLGELKVGDEKAKRSGSEGESEEEVEEGMRMAFMRPADVSGKGGRSRRREAQRSVLAAAAEPVDVAGGVGGEEDEEESWAAEQIRKGLGVASRAPAPMPAAGTSGRSDVGGAVNDEGRGSVFARPSNILGTGAASRAAAIATAGQQAVQAMQEGVQRLQAAHAASQRQLAKVNSSVDASVRAISDLEVQLKTAGHRYTSAQQLRAYIADLCDMLQEKSTIVEVLEEEMAELAAQRGTVAAMAAVAGADEELGAGQAAVAAALSVLGSGGGQQAAADAAERAFADAEATAVGRDLPVQLDEFGRDGNMEKRLQAQQRMELRRRRLSHAAASASGGGEVTAGDVSSDEEDEEVSHYDARRKEILEAASRVFADADDEFGTLEGIKARLESVRHGHPSAYRDAYLSEAAPALFAPLVRLQLLEWDPVYWPGKGIDSQAWFATLFDFGLAPPLDTNGHAAGHNEIPDDTGVIPALVAKLVVPLALSRVKHCWSVASTRASRGVAGALEELALFDLAQEPVMQELLQEVKGKLAHAVHQISLPPWPPNAVAVHKPTHAILALRFSRALRVLRSITNFDGVLERGWLLRLALLDCVKGKLLQYLRAAAAQLPVAAQRISRVLEALPDAWFAGGTPPEARDLLELTQAMSNTLRGLSNTGAGRSDANRAAVTQLVVALARLGDKETAAALQIAYS